MATLHAFSEEDLCYLRYARLPMRSVGQNVDREAELSPRIQGEVVTEEGQAESKFVRMLMVLHREGLLDEETYFAHVGNSFRREIAAGRLGHVASLAAGLQLSNLRQHDARLSRQFLDLLAAPGLIQAMVSALDAGKVAAADWSEYVRLLDPIALGRAADALGTLRNEEARTVVVERLLCLAPQEPAILERCLSVLREDEMARALSRLGERGERRKGA